MFKPVHLQDNLSKTLLVQEIVDRMIAGTDKLKEWESVVHQKEHERTRLREAMESEEKPGTKTVNEDGRNQQRQPKKKKQNKETESTIDVTDEDVNDLRLRREEDDRGKGSKLDLRG